MKTHDPARFLLWAILLGVVAIILTVIYAPQAKAHKPKAGWQRAYVTGYSTRENLTGCYAPGRCRMACGRDLNDNLYTVAANPRHGLGCGQKIIVCNRGKCVKAVVMDRTASHFDFEFTVALAYATGSPRGYPAFATPRWVVWRKVWR